MANRFEPNFDGVKAVMQSPGVRAALRVRAEAVKSRANSDDPELGAYVRDGTRPKGRPYSRVISDDGAEREFGSSKTARRRTLGRAAGLE